MNLSNKGPPTNDKKLSPPSKLTSLNPNAAEFVPFALRSPSGSTHNTTADGSSRFSALGKTVLDRSESSVSNNSDDEAQQYWRLQLPDDITPDFREDDDSQGINSLPFSSFSLTDVNEASRFSSSHHGINGGGFADKSRFSVSSPYGEDPSSGVYHHLHAKPWDNPLMENENLMTSAAYNGNSGHGFLGDMLNEHQQMVETNDMNPIELLASQFPGFAAESLAEVFVANGGDLNLTVEMLTQLELQVDGGLNQNLNSKALSAPNLSALDFPALSASDGQNGMPKFSGEDLQPNASPYHRASDKENLLMFKSSNSIPSRGSIDFASAVRKLASQDYGMWKYDRNGSSADASVGSSRSSHVLASSYNGGQGRGVYGNDRLQSRGSSRTAPVWLETGEAVANMYTEMREEARDHARLRNLYFEQVLACCTFSLRALSQEAVTESRTHSHSLGERGVGWRGSAAVSDMDTCGARQTCPTQSEVLWALSLILARQAYLIGNKALAKELSVKGQLHNMHMKAAHGKAQESIYRQRNPVSSQMQQGGNGRGQERIIDLHGLHVSEAIHVLKRDLAMLRSAAARSGEQRLQVYICVGTGHHTRGSRTPARLPTAVQRYLLEEEGLDFTEPQPGLLRVVIY
ncbi:hypothetical protein LguiA_017860 [Lonicera macranthoides]